MTAPLVTVAIANYNGARFLARTIESVLAQTVPDIDVVLVDNASTDHSLAVAGAFADSRLRVAAFDEFVPVTANWNRGLDEARGQYFSLLHSDDIWYPEFLEHTMAALDTHPTAAAAIGNARIIDEDDAEIDRATFRARQRDWTGVFPDSGYEELLCQMNVFPCSWLARRELIEHDRFDEGFVRAPDWEFWLRIFAANELVSVPTAWSGYRIHETNDTFTTTTLRGMRADELAIVRAALDRRTVSPHIARRALRMIDIRTSIRCAQVVARGDLRAAAALTRDTVRTEGLRGLARGWFGLATLPETRIALGDVARKLGRRG